MKQTTLTLLPTCLLTVQAQQPSFLLQQSTSAFARYGNPKCPCIGIDNIEGNVTYNGTYFPADLGARCEAWSEDRHLDCKVDKPPSWCQNQWCYVDPCNCDAPEPPKHSKWFEMASYNGKLLYYSYSTCGSKDTWTEKNNEHACINHKTEKECLDKGADDMCDWIDKRCLPFELSGVCKGFKPNEKKYGKVDCPCVGVAGMPGNISMKNGLKYPADTGSSCDTWGKKAHHPDCTGEEPAGWCEQEWCYVDPCHCNLPEGQPEQAAMLKGAIFQGKPLYYSYATCGSEDKWSSSLQCKTKTDADSCENLADCVWNGTKCLGWELDGLCDLFEKQREEKGELQKIEAPLAGKAPPPKKKEPVAKKASAKKAVGKMEVEAEAEDKVKPKKSSPQPDFLKAGSSILRLPIALFLFAPAFL